MNNIKSSISVGPVLWVLSLNIEGASTAKSQILQKMAESNDVHIIHIQETHIKNEADLESRLTVSGYMTIASVFHEKYGFTTLAFRQTLNVTRQWLNVSRQRLN